MSEAPALRFRARGIDDRGRYRTAYVTVHVADHTPDRAGHIHLAGAEVASLARDQLTSQHGGTWDVYQITPLSPCPVSAAHRPHGSCVQFPPEDSP